MLRVINVCRISMCVFGYIGNRVIRSVINSVVYVLLIIL